MIAMTKFFRQYLLGILATSLSLVAVEPSAYSAGDLSLKNPYGLTSAEKQILADREMIEKLEQRVKALESTQKGLSESLDGVKSLYEGNAQQTNPRQVCRPPSWRSVRPALSWPCRRQPFRRSLPARG